MSYEHKDFVQSDTRRILSNNGFVQINKHMWKRVIKVKCPDCQGNGYVIERFLYVFSKKIVCKKCNGNGNYTN